METEVMESQKQRERERERIKKLCGVLLFRHVCDPAT